MDEKNKDKGPNNWKKVKSESSNAAFEMLLACANDKIVSCKMIENEEEKVTSVELEDDDESFCIIKSNESVLACKFVGMMHVNNDNNKRDE